MFISHVTLYPAEASTVVQICRCAPPLQKPVNPTSQSQGTRLHQRNVQGATGSAKTLILTKRVARLNVSACE